MTEYIDRLTDELIGKHKFHIISKEITSRQEHFNYIRLTIRYDDIGRMRPETLGRVMGDLAQGEVAANKEDLLKHVAFIGDCKNFLCELVAVCLAYVIQDRLNPVSENKSVPRSKFVIQAA
jgi:hypothetical protein